MESPIYLALVYSRQYIIQKIWPSHLGLHGEVGGGGRRAEDAADVECRRFGREVPFCIYTIDL